MGGLGRASRRRPRRDLARGAARVGDGQAVGGPVFGAVDAAAGQLGVGIAIYLSKYMKSGMFGYFSIRAKYEFAVQSKVVVE